MDSSQYEVRAIIPKSLHHQGHHHLQSSWYSKRSSVIYTRIFRELQPEEYENFLLPLNVDEFLTQTSREYALIFNEHGIPLMQMYNKNNAITNGIVSLHHLKVIAKALQNLHRVNLVMGSLSPLFNIHDVLKDLNVNTLMLSIHKALDVGHRPALPYTFSSLIMKDLWHQNSLSLEPIRM